MMRTNQEARRFKGARPMARPRGNLAPLSDSRSTIPVTHPPAKNNSRLQSRRPESDGTTPASEYDSSHFPEKSLQGFTSLGDSAPVTP